MLTATSSLGDLVDKYPNVESCSDAFGSMSCVADQMCLSGSGDLMCGITPWEIHFGNPGFTRMGIPVMSVSLGM
jgi:hypothetical protein